MRSCLNSSINVKRELTETKETATTMMINTTPCSPASPRTIRVITALIFREMATNQGRSGLGYVWIIIEPLAVIALLSVLFSLFFHTPALGRSFPLFYASGFLPFQIFSQIQMAVQGAISQNRQLLFFPQVSPLEAIFARFVLALMTQCAVALLVLLAILNVFAPQETVNLDYVICSVFSAALIGFGTGMINAVLLPLLPVWRHIWSVAMRPLFLGSCIFFLFDALPAGLRDMLWFNPLVHTVGYMRKGIYGEYHGDYLSMIYPLGIAGIAILFGLVLVRSFAKDIVNG